MESGVILLEVSSQFEISKLRALLHELHSWHFPNTTWESVEMTAVTTSTAFFRVHTMDVSPDTPTSPHRPIPGLTSSPSEWQWCLGGRSRLQWRLLAKPFLAGFSPFFTCWHSSPLASLVAGLSVIAGQRLGSCDCNWHVWTRSLPTVQSGDSIRAGSVYKHTPQTLTLSHARTAHTQTHILSKTWKSRRWKPEINAP